MYNKHLEAFINAADLGSFSKAAGALYISPTSLIQQITLLENHLGIQLFTRTARGVTLTEAGLSIYQDAKNIIRLSGNAIERAKMIAEKNYERIRIGTSLLTKCRYLSDFVARMIELYPETKIELVSLKSPDITNLKPLSDLGISYELQEGLYLSEFYKGRCNFLEFCQTPLCASMTSNHHLASCPTISFDNLKGETVFYIKRGVSSEFDLLRDELENFSEIKLIDIEFYDINIFTSCELNDSILLGPAIWNDIHPALEPHMLEKEITVPYGLIYPFHPDEQVQKLLSIIKELL